MRWGKVEVHVPKTQGFKCCGQVCDHAIPKAPEGYDSSGFCPPLIWNQNRAQLPLQFWAEVPPFLTQVFPSILGFIFI